MNKKGREGGGMHASTDIAFSILGGVHVEILLCYKDDTGITVFMIVPSDHIHIYHEFDMVSFPNPVEITHMKSASIKTLFFSYFAR